LDDQHLWDLFFNAIIGEDIGIAEKVTQILIQLSKNSEGLKAVFHNSILSQLKKSVQVNEIVKFRVLDLFTSISAISLQAFQLCESNGCLQEIIDSFNTNDLLQQLNVIELLEKISFTHEGTSFLEKVGTFQKLASILILDDPLISFLVPRVITFFGHLGSKGEIEVGFLDKYNVIPKLKTLLEEGNQETKESVIMAVGEIGSFPHGLFLLSQSNIFEEYFYSINTESIRICLLHSLALLLKKIAKNLTPKADALLQELLQQVPTRKAEEPILNAIHPWITQPFPELRYAVYDVLSGLASIPWGLQKELQYPGFYEFITNRGTDDTKAGKEWKYTIIQIMVETLKTNTQLLAKPQQNELARYLKSGVFWVDAQATLEVKTKDMQ